MIILYVDECHLVWDDVRGYVWTAKGERVAIEMSNYRQRQSYFGAVNPKTGEMIVKECKAGNGENTVEFVQDLINKYKGSRLIIIWDGASYHTGMEMRAFLDKVNRGLSEEEYKVRCVKFAPNAPEQNPIEDIWLQGKQEIRKKWYLCDKFASVKELFVSFLKNTGFSFEKLRMYFKS